MPRNGSGVYSLPAGLPTNGETSNATDDILTPFGDVETDLNTPRPVVAGGTGASSASGARANLGLGSLATLSSVDTAQIADSAVETAKINDAAVTTAKIADANVTTAKIADSSVTTAKIADANVTTAKIATGAVTFSKIATGDIETTITDSDTKLPTSSAVVDYVAANGGNYTLLTPQATTSGTGVSFTGIPSTATEIIIMFNGTSLDSTDHLRIQAIVASSPVTTGYTSHSFGGVAAALGNGGTDGFRIVLGNDARAVYGTMNLTKFDSGNDWVESHSVALGTILSASGGGFVSLAGAIDGIRVEPTGGNFNAGEINVGYR